MPRKNFLLGSDRTDEIYDLEMNLEWLVDYGWDGERHETLNLVGIGTQFTEA